MAVIDTAVVDYIDIDYIDNLVVLEDHKLVVVVLVDIFRNILQVKQLLQNLSHNWVHYKPVDHNLDLNRNEKLKI